MADTDTKKAAADDENRVVDVVILKHTSLSGRFLAPGRNRLRLFEAKHMQSQGLARPPAKVEKAVLAVPEEDAEGIDDEDRGEGFGSEDE